MRLFLLIAALLLQAPVPRGSVAGTVIVAGTSTPIADAEVALVTPDGVLETTTDASGRFALSDVPAGRQTILIRADGFFIQSTTPNTPFASRAEVPVTVTAGATPVAIPNVAMVRGGTVSGKIVDPMGNPLPFVRVLALRPEVGTLNSGATPDFGNRMTDDRGEYRMFFVPPGEYVIRALVQGRPAGPVQSRPGEIQALVSTLYPNTTDITQAGKVIVKSGEEVRGIDISVKMEIVTLPPPAPKPTGGVKISGLVIDGLLPRIGGGQLILVSESDPAPRPVGNVIIGGTPGAFDIPNVQPGRYDLFVSMGHESGSPGPGGGGGVQAWGRAKFEVLDKDIDGIRMTVHPSMDVPGVVKIDGKVAPAGGTLKIGLSPTGTTARLGNYRGILDRTQTPGDGGKVSIPRAAEGNYQFFIQGADDLYIADVRQGETSILVSGIDVRNATPAPFEILLTSGGGAVEGVISNRDKSPMGGATVALVPADKQLLQLYRTVTTGPDGKYSFRGVRPGEYKVFAGPGQLPPGGLTPELLSRIEPSGTSVTVKAGTSTKADAVISN